MIVLKCCTSSVWKELPSKSFSILSRELMKMLYLKAIASLAEVADPTFVFIISCKWSGLIASPFAMADDTDSKANSLTKADSDVMWPPT